MDEKTAAALAHARGLLLRKLIAGYKQDAYELRRIDGRGRDRRGLSLDDVAAELASMATDDG